MIVLSGCQAAGYVTDFFSPKTFLHNEKDGLFRFCTTPVLLHAETNLEGSNPIPRFAGGGEAPPARFCFTNLWLLPLLMALFAGLPGAVAQTGQRISIHTLSNNDQGSLAELIKNWLNENPNIPIEHRDCFNEGIQDRKSVV